MLLANVVGDSGLLFKLGDVNDLVKKIMSLKDQKYYFEKSKAGIKNSLTYSIEGTAKQYINIYKEELK